MIPTTRSVLDFTPADMEDTIEEKVKKGKSFFTSVNGMITAAFLTVSLIVGGYVGLEKQITERNAERISEATIKSIKKELNPISRTEFLEFRRRDSIQRLNAELIALNYMNRTDSMLIVINDAPKMVKLLNKRFDRLETKVEVRELPNEDDQLARIWEFLKKREIQDSTAHQLEEMMKEIRELNRQKIQNIKSGDRAE